MSETNQQLQVQIPSLPSAEDFKKTLSWLKKAHDQAVDFLKGVTPPTTQEEYNDIEESLVEIKKVYDQMYAKRKALSDPIKDMIANMMVYENAINYTAKSENEYNRVRKFMEDFNQAKLDEKKKQEHLAWLSSERVKYKADYKAKVQEQLADMLDGIRRTVIHKLDQWEAAYTLENFAVNSDKIKRNPINLELKKWEDCFRLWGARPELMNKKDEEDYLVELKALMPYEQYNIKLQEIITPIKNAHIAKLPDVKKRLDEMAAADAKKQKELQAKAEEDRKKALEQNLKQAENDAAKERETIAAEKEIGQMEGDFVNQGMTQNLEKIPTKKAAKFADDKDYKAPFLRVVGDVLQNPKYKGVLSKDGAYKKEVQPWLDLYADYHVDKTTDGIVIFDVPKTILRKKSE